MRGKKHTSATRRKISEACKGEKSPHWKGGVRNKNRIIRRDVEYTLWRESVFSRDNFTCQMPGCDQRGGNLEANHIKKFADYPSLRTALSNGITLCTSCHTKTKWKEQFWEPLFTRIVKPNL